MYFRHVLMLSLLLFTACGKTPPPPFQVKVDDDPAKKQEVAAKVDIGAVVAQLGDRSPAKRQDAVELIVRLDQKGEDAVPALLKALSDPSCDELGLVHPRELHSTREAAAKTLLALGARGEKALLGDGLKSLRDGLADSKPAVREHTAYALALLGPKAHPAADELVKLCSDTSKEVRRAAYRALEVTGAAPADPILKLLTHDEPDICTDAAEALAWLKIERADAVPLLVAGVISEKLGDKMPQAALFVRNAAAAALGRMGSKAAGAIPILVDAVKRTTTDELRVTLQPEANRNRRGRVETGAMQALRRIGKPAVPALIPLLKEPLYAVRWQAATILGGIGPDAKEALPELQSALENEREAFIVISATALAQVQIGGDPEKSVARLTALLGDEQPGIRAATANVLERFGRAAAPAVDKLLPLLDDPEDAVRLTAAEALRAIGPSAAKAVPALVKKLADAKGDAAVNVVRTLRGLGPVAAPAVPELKKALLSDDLSLREAAVETIAAIGPGAKDATPELSKMLGEKLVNLNNYLPIIAAVAAIGPGAKDAAPALLKLLDEKETALRIAAVGALGKIGASSTEALNRLKVIVQKDAFGAVRVAAVRALGEIGPAAKDAAPVLKTLVEGKNADQRIWAAAALTRMGIDASANTAIVIAALKDSAPSARNLRLVAIEASGLLGPAGSDAVPELTELLRERAPLGRGDRVQVRERAAAALGQLGGTAKPAVAKLADMLADAEEPVRRAALAAIAQLGTSAADAIPRLRELIRTDEDLVAAAQEALDRVDPPKE